MVADRTATVAPVAGASGRMKPSRIGWRPPTGGAGSLTAGGVEQPT